MKTLSSCPSARSIIAAVLLAILLALAIHPVVLAEQEKSPSTFASGDIQFCPKGKPYQHSLCSPVRPTVQAAIDDALTAAAAGISGTIYLEDGVYSYTTNNASGGMINLTGFDYGTSLTIQGGVLVGTTTFVRQVYMHDNLGLDLSLVNVSLATGAVSEDGFYGSTNTGDISFTDVVANTTIGSGIYLYQHTGDVSLYSVTAQSNPEYGILLNDIEGKVTLQDLTLENNYNDNIWFEEIDGDVSLTDVTATGSTIGSGIYFFHVYGTKGVTLKNITANNNDNYNLMISTITGNASLSNLQANYSSTGGGIYIHHVDGSKGITLKDVTADDNKVTNIYTANAASVSMSNVQASNANDSDGIFIQTIGGRKGITLKNVTANNNNQNNFYIANITGDVKLATIQGSNSVTSNGINLLNINGSKGISAKGMIVNGNGVANMSISNISSNVSLSDIQASSAKGGIGIAFNTVNGSKGITIKNAVADTNDSQNVYINDIEGNIILSGVHADGSVNSSGIVMQNIRGVKGVNLKNVEVNNNNYYNIEIELLSGNVSMSQVRASSNTNWDSILINNIFGSKGVTFKDVTANLSDENNIYIGTVLGNVTLSKVEANQSVNECGIYIYNVQGTKGVNLSSVTANDNHEFNIYASAINGSANLKSVQANNSTDHPGIQLTAVDGAKGVSLSNVSAEYNYGHNIYIANIANDVNIKNVTANNSDVSGGLNITSISGEKGVMIKGITANGNSLQNIYIEDVFLGGVNINSAIAGGSINDNGVNISSVAGVVMVIKSSFNGNGLNGLRTASISNLVALKSVQANDNTSGNGLYLASYENQLVCSSEFNNNQYGIYSSTTSDSLTISKVIFSGNSSGETFLVGTTIFESTKCKVIPPP